MPGGAHFIPARICAAFVRAVIGRFNWRRELKCGYRRLLLRREQAAHCGSEQRQAGSPQRLTRRSKPASVSSRQGQQVQQQEQQRGQQQVHCGGARQSTTAQENLAALSNGANSPRRAFDATPRHTRCGHSGNASVSGYVRAAHHSTRRRAVAARLEVSGDAQQYIHHAHRLRASLRSV